MESASKLNHDPLRFPKHSPQLPFMHHFERLSFTLVLIVSSAIASIFLPLALSAFLLLTLHLWCKYRSSQVYLVDFVCYRPPDYCRVPHATFIEHMSLLGLCDKNSVKIIKRVLGSSGQGERTCLPPCLALIPPRSTHEDSVEEFHMTLFPILESLLCKAKMCPKEVDILIVNCSGFCPSPSLSSIVVNRFKMREDVKSFTLSGMGCSASMIAVDMAANLLKVHKNSNVVILSTEILTTGWYAGKDPSKQVLNCVFRMGSAAVLLTNRRTPTTTPKYKLLHTYRTHRSSSDKGYRSAFREEDDLGVTGVTLRRDILPIAADMLKSTITDVGLSILPISEKLKYVVSFLKSRVLGGSVYVPEFKTVIRHFCFPTSGRPMIRDIGEGLRLEEEDIAPAMATLHRFGNQSSSSLWYEMAYLEEKGKVNKGDKVWQLGMGSGPKCASVVWECVGPDLGRPKNGPWADCIDLYPKLAFE